MPEPPWAGQPALEAETTPEGLPIIRTRHGSFVREDGQLYLYVDGEDLARRVRRSFQAPARPACGPFAWDAWTAG